VQAGGSEGRRAPSSTTHSQRPPSGSCDLACRRGPSVVSQSAPLSGGAFRPRGRIRLGVSRRTLLGPDESPASSRRDERRSGARPRDARSRHPAGEGDQSVPRARRSSLGGTLPRARAPDPARGAPRSRLCLVERTQAWGGRPGSRSMLVRGVVSAVGEKPSRCRGKRRPWCGHRPGCCGRVGDEAARSESMRHRQCPAERSGFVGRTMNAGEQGGRTTKRRLRLETLPCSSAS
jgi:hypothetical protein